VDSDCSGGSDYDADDDGYDHIDYDGDGEDCDDTDPAIFEDCDLGECFRTEDAYTVRIDAAEFIADFWTDSSYSSLPAPLSFGVLPMVLTDDDDDSTTRVVTKAIELSWSEGSVCEQDFCQPTLTLFKDTDGDFKAAGTPVDIGAPVVSTRLSSDHSTIAFKVNAVDLIDETDLYVFASAIYSDAMGCCVMDAGCPEAGGMGGMGEMGAGTDTGMSMEYCAYIEFPLESVTSDDCPTSLDVIPDDGDTCHLECDSCGEESCPID
jgi:hypothetical protein